MEGLFTIMENDKYKEMSNEDKYNKYNKLIEGFRKAIMDERKKDLKTLDNFIAPYSIKTIKNNVLECVLNEKKSKENKLDISYVGKFIVREKSVENGNLYWFIKNKEGKLEKQSHIGYLLRYNLKKKNSKGVLESYPLNMNIPFNVKKSYRQLNGKLNIALNVPEIMMCANRFGEMDPNKFPSQFMKRNAKGLLNEKLKVSPTGSYEEENGNRYPESKGRVDLRKKMREMFRDPKRVNSGQIFPHNIAYDAKIANSTAYIEMNQALWDSKIIDTLEKMRITQESILKGDYNGSGLKMDVGKALSSGKFIGCADVSASMTWVSEAPNRPFDIAVGLTTFLSEIAHESYRDLGLSFTTQPKIFNFKVGNRKMTLKERINHICNYSGGSTNYLGLHKEVLRLCVENKVKEEDIPVIVVFTDGQFDSMDNSLHSNSYSYSYNSYNNGSNSESSIKKWKTIHENIVEMWVNANYSKIPTIVYWNLNGNTSNVQESSDYPGVMFLQGNSVNNIKYILYGECAEETTIEVNGKDVSCSSMTPYETFKIAMSQEYLSRLDGMLKESSENLLEYYI